MRHLFLILGIILLSGCEKQPVVTGNPITPGSITSSTTGDLRTVFSNDWDNWNIYTGSTSVNMRTVFSEDWDNWQLNMPGQSISLKTVFTEDWDNWELKDNSSGDNYSIKTTFSNDFDNWVVYKNGIRVMDMKTDFSNDFDNWYVKNYTVNNNLHKSCILFIPIFISAIHQQGIIQ